MNFIDIRLISKSKYLNKWWINSETRTKVDIFIRSVETFKINFMFGEKSAEVLSQFNKLEKYSSAWQSSQTMIEILKYLFFTI